MIKRLGELVSTLVACNTLTLHAHCTFCELFLLKGFENVYNRSGGLPSLYYSAVLSVCLYLYGAQKGRFLCRDRGRSQP